MDEPTEDAPARADGQNNMSRAGKARRNVISSSPHRDEYEELMRQGWSSYSIERFALFRWGEVIPARTVQSYKSRKKITAAPSKGVAKFNGVEAADVLLDVLHERAELVALQKARLEIDLRHEREISKLFSTTKAEIKLLSELVDRSKEDLQDLGLFPKIGVKHELVVRDGPVGNMDPSPSVLSGGAPPARSLGELMRQMNPAEEQALARMIDGVLPADGRNGQVVELPARDETG